MSLITVIIPNYNGSAYLKGCLDSLQNQTMQDFDICVVDDGSTDGTGDLIRAHQFRNVKMIQLITFSKNFGSHAAIRAGIAKARFDLCTWMGSDLQEPLEFLQLSWDRIAEGYDAVYVEKRSVEVSSANRSFSRFYSYLMRKYAVSSYASGGISTIVFDRKIMNYVNGNQESNSSIMLQIMDAGFKSSLLSLDFNSRYAGESKWTLKKKVKLFIDSFVSFSFMPIRLVSIMGCILFLIGLIIGLVTIVNAFVNPNVPLGYSTLACLISLGFGVTNISLGILAEYLWRTLDAARGRAPYTIDTVEDLLEECSPKA